MMCGVPHTHCFAPHLATATQNQAALLVSEVLQQKGFSLLSSSFLHAALPVPIGFSRYIREKLSLCGMLARADKHGQAALMPLQLHDHA